MRSRLRGAHTRPLAIAQIDQTTQQNAALVEESASAAESLRHQATRMAEVVRQFRLE